MSSSDPRAKLLLLKDYQPHEESEPDLGELHRKLSALPGFDQVELEPNGHSTVFASVPARNQRECDRLKALVNDRIDGWRVIEEHSYQVPTTF
jgi:hypothetical protein